MLNNNFLRGVTVAGGILAGSIGLGNPAKANEERGFDLVGSQVNVTRTLAYQVVEGDTLTSISKNFGVGLDVIINLNSADLGVEFLENCSPNDIKKAKRKSTKYGIKGWCSEAIATIMPGFKIRLPLKDTEKLEDQKLQDPTPGNTVTFDPNSNVLNIPDNVDEKVIPQVFKDIIKEAIEPIKEDDKIALIVDRSGSMGNDRDTVSKWVKEMDINGASIYGYSEYVRKLSKSEADGYIGDLGNGGKENIIKAIKKAIRDGNNKIIIITDEEGDDWAELEGKFNVKITTLLINDADYKADCNNTRYKEIGHCVNVK